MNRFLFFVDELNEKLGRLVAWLVVVIVLVGSWNAVARFLAKGIGRGVNLNALQDAQWYLFSLLFLLGAAHALRRDAHVRVDVFSSRASPRARNWINLLGATFLLIPFCIVVIWAAWPLVHDAWAVREASPDPGGLARYPIKTAIPIGFALLLLQGLSEWARSAHALRTRREPKP